MNDSHMIEYSCGHQSYPQHDHICCWKQFSVIENLIVPDGKPDIEDLLEVRAYPKIETCKMIDTPFGKKMVIMGKIEQKIIYVADVSCQSVHFFHATRPFCSFIQISPQSSCSSAPQYHDSRCFSDHHNHRLCPSIMIEYICARKTGPREVSKCVILLVWCDKNHPHPHPNPEPHPHPHCPSGTQDCDNNSMNIGDCSTCKYASGCPSATAR